METFKVITYLLAALSSAACTLMLFRGYAKTGTRLLLWSALCFVGLTANNFLLFFDLSMFRLADLRPYRLIAALTGLMFLLYGSIWEAE